MTTTVVQCRTCKKTGRPTRLWSEEFVAGLSLGAQCPACVTAEDQVEADVNAVFSSPDTFRAKRITSEDEFVNYVYRLLDLYPTPQIMRAKAAKLAAARSDEGADKVLTLMHRLADDMESGALYDEAGQ